MHRPESSSSRSSGSRRSPPLAAIQRPPTVSDETTRRIPQVETAVAAAEDGSHQSSPFLEKDFAKAREALAISGYPHPHEADILRVLEVWRLGGGGDEQSPLQQHPTAVEKHKSAGSSSHGSQDSAADNSSPHPPAWGAPPRAETFPSPVQKRDATLSRPRTQGFTTHAHSRSAGRSVSSSNSATTPATSRPAWNDDVHLTGPSRQADCEKTRAGSAASARRHPPGAVLVPPRCEVPTAAAILSPSVRLERYIRRQERAIHSFYGGCSTTPAGVTHHHQQQQHGDPTTIPYGAAHLDEQAGSSLAGRVMAMPRRYTVVGTSRRSANVIYDITGDQRYRFRPVSIADPTTRSTVPLPDRAFKNLYSTASNRRHGVSARLVSCLDADGSTLKYKADPVKRGQQMRMLWDRDRFLTQKDRRRDMWETRQATMAYHETL